MNELNKSQTGFGSIELILVFAIIVAVAGVWAYVLHKTAYGDSANVKKMSDSYIASFMKNDYAGYKSIYAKDTKAIILGKEEFGMDAVVFKYRIKSMPVRIGVGFSNGGKVQRAVATYDTTIDNGTSAGIKSNIAVFLQKNINRWEVVGIDNSDATTSKASTDPTKYDDNKFNSWYYFVNISTLATPYPIENYDNTVKDKVRTTDLRLIHDQLAVYFDNERHYPSLTDLNSSSDIPGVDNPALADPEVTPEYAKNGLATAPTIKAYSYSVSDKNGVSCEDQAENCVSYTLTATLSTGKLYSLSAQ